MSNYPSNSGRMPDDPETDNERAIRMLNEALEDIQRVRPVIVAAISLRDELNAKRLECEMIGEDRDAARQARDRQKRVNFSDLSDSGRLEWANWTQRAYDRITVETMEWSHTMRALRGASPALDLEEEILDFLEWVGQQDERWHELLTPEAHARIYPTIPKHKFINTLNDVFNCQECGQSESSECHFFGQPDTEGSDETWPLKTSHSSTDKSKKLEPCIQSGPQPQEQNESGSDAADGSNPR